MPTIIDSLLVSVGLDSKELTAQSGSATKQLKDLEGSGKSTEGQIKKLSDTTKTTASSMSALSRGLTAVAAAFGGFYAMKSFVEDTVASNAALERLSKNLNLSVEDVSAWGLAVEGVGGSAKGLQGTMQMLSQSQTELSLTGQSSLIPYFASIKVAMADTAGQARPVNDILLDLADRFGQMDRREAFNIGKMMGIDTDTLNLLVQGRQEVELQIKRQKEFNAVSKAQAEESAKLQKSIIGLQQTFSALGRNLLQQASPAIEKVLGVLTNLGSWITRNTEFIKDLGIVLGVIAAGFAAISLAASPVALVVGGVLLLAGAIALLWQDYQVWQRGGKSLLNWGQWKSEIDLAKAGINDLKKVALTAFDAIITAARVAWDAIHGNWGALKKDLAHGTLKMNDAIGLKTGPDEANDQNAARADRFVSGVRSFVPKALKSIWGSDTSNLANKNTLTGSIAQVEGFNAKGAKPNRPQRDHNPGDLEYGDFAKKHGATGSDGRFAIFPDDATGFAALQALLQTKSYRNLTVPQAINRFAPPNENNTAGYAASVMKATGATASTTVAQTLAGASSMVASAGNGPPRGAGGSTDKSTTVHITGPITLNTQATDANGIARDLVPAIKWQFAAQANSGMS